MICLFRDINTGEIIELEYGRDFVESSGSIYITKEFVAQHPDGGEYNIRVRDDIPPTWLSDKEVPPTG